MRAVTYVGPGEVALAEVPIPAVVEPTDALVKVTLAGICGTDLHVVRGDFPGIERGQVIGHEFVGEVVEVGRDVRRVRPGDEVMSSDFTACGHCHWCDRGDHWHCRERAFFGTGTSFGPALSGAQAEYVRVPHADVTLAALPAGCSPEAALLIGDNLATGWVATERARLQPGECAAVIGGGAVGQLAALCAQATGAGAVIVIEPNPVRRRFAQAHGSLAVHPDEAPAFVRGVAGEGGGAEVVIEAVGGNAPLDLALRLAAPAGRIVSVGTHAAPQWGLPVARAFRDELSVGFAIGDAIRLRQRLLRLVTGGALDPAVVIDARGRLDDAPQLYRRLTAQTCLKAVVSLS
jgi:2-desacetyl-2-hydroxyethyl bacteriochlorophyllide A dehydrogenase